MCYAIDCIVYACTFAPRIPQTLVKRTKSTVIDNNKFIENKRKKKEFLGNRAKNSRTQTKLLRFVLLFSINRQKTV